MNKKAQEIIGSEVIKLVLVVIAVVFLVAVLYKIMDVFVEKPDSVITNNFDRMIEDIKDVKEKVEDEEKEMEIDIPLNFGDYLVKAYNENMPAKCKNNPCLCLGKPDKIDKNPFKCEWRMFKDTVFEMKKDFFKGEVTIKVNIDKREDKTHISLDET